MLFVPNIAESISKAAPGVIYGVILIVFLFLLPDGFAGLLRRIAAPGCAAPRLTANDRERQSHDHHSPRLPRRRPPVPSPCPRIVPAQEAPGVTATEIRIGSTNALSGPASSYSRHLRAASTAMFKRLNDQGGIAGRQGQLHRL